MFTYETSTGGPILTVHGHIRRWNSSQYPSILDEVISKLWMWHSPITWISEPFNEPILKPQMHTHKGKRHACTVRSLKLRCLGDQVNCDITNMNTHTRQYSGIVCQLQLFDHKHLRQVQKSFACTWRRSWNIVRLQSTALHEMLNVTTDI